MGTRAAEFARIVRDILGYLYTSSRRVAGSVTERVGRVLSRWLGPVGATVTRRIVVAATAVAVMVGSAVAVVLVTDNPSGDRGPLAGAGEAFDVELDPLAAMKRPKADAGVKLDEPKEPASEQVKRPGVKSKKVCAKPEDGGAKSRGKGVEGDGASPLDTLLGVDDGTEVCVYAETRQANEVPDHGPLTMAEGYEPAPVPNQPGPSNEVGDPDDNSTVDPSDDPSDGPSGQPSEDPSSGSSDGPSDGSSGTPSGEPADESSSGSGPAEGSSGDDAADPRAGRRAGPARPASHNGMASAGAGENARAQHVPALSSSGAGQKAVLSDTVAAVATPSAGEYLSPNWVQLSPAAAPAASTEAVMAYDVVRQQVVRFGGRNDAGAALAQTWVWNGLTWVQKSPATSPPARYRASMAWDATLGKLVVFGGQSGATGWLNDVWAWDGTTWAQVSTAGSAPTARAGAMMAYDTGRSALVVFGGINGSGPRNDTFQLKTTGTVPSTTTTWTQVQAHGVAGAPPARFDGALAYSAATNQLLLFGGATSCGSGTCATLNDTWILGPTASTWTAKNPTHKPASRSSMAMSLDPGLGVVPAGAGVDPSKGAVVLFGGISYSGTTPTLHHDTWAWMGDDWAQAVGNASPTGRAGMSMASDDDGQMVMFGGVGGATGTTFLDETWAYDASLPVLEIEVSGASGGTTEDPVFYTGDVAEIQVTAHNTGTAAINDVTLTSALQSTLLAAGSIFKLDGTQLGACPPVVTALCAGVEDLTAAINMIDIPIGGSRIGDFLAAVVGTQRGCSLIDVPAIVSDLLGASAEVYSQLTVCGGGLGLEKWWTYDTTDLGTGGGGGTASVNVANGNLVVQQTDAPPVQARGRLALGVSRVYNSQGSMTDGLGDPLGIGWQFDLGETGEFAGGFGVGGFPILPNIHTVLQPLSMPYTDRDGTQHTFKLRSVGATIGDVNLPIDLTQSGDGTSGGLLQQILKLLNPQTLLYPLVSTVVGQKYGKLCIDQAYTGPPGSNMYLFRYIGTASSGCANPATDGFVQVGWSLVRPDRVRYDYDILGRIIAVTDPAGQQIKYEYSLEDTHGPTRIYVDSCGKGATCPSINIEYTDPAPIGYQHVKITDSAGRITSYLIRHDGPTPYLAQVWEPGNPLPPYDGVPGSDTDARPSWTYTYSTASQECPGSDPDAKTTGQLCSATDALGHTTTFAYTPAPIGPDRVLQVTDRRGNDTDSDTGDGGGATKGLATRYSWANHSSQIDAPPVQVSADMGSPSQVEACSAGTDTTCQRINYTSIDNWGRVGEINEGDSGGNTLRQSGYFWDGLGEGVGDMGGIESCSLPLNAPMNHNLCQTIRRAKPSNDPLVPGEAGTATVDGVTVQDEAIAYNYGTLGQTLRRRVLLDASLVATQGWTDANSAITTWGSHDQYFDANGDQRVFTNFVRGDGDIGTSAVGSQYVAAVDADNPYAYWRLGETSGTTMTARTGPNGTYQTGVTIGAPGVIGDNPAINESPTGNGAVVNPLNGFANGTGASSAFTVESWQKTTDTTQSQRTFAWGTTSAYAEVGRNYGGHPIIYLSSDVAFSEAAAIAGADSIADGEWHHVVYTYDGSGSTGGMAIWVDGVEQAVVVVDDDLSGSFASASAAGSTGRGGPGSSMDELTLYTAVLPRGRIIAHFKAGFGANPVEADTLYATTDQIQELSPRGNSTGSWGDYLTTIRRDLPPNGTLASTNKPGDPTICGSATKGNTGLVCEIDTPSSAGVSAGACTSPTAGMPAGSPAAPTSTGYTHACTTYEYNAAGQRTFMKSPKANAANRSEVTEYRYYDDSKTTCAGAAQANCDLSGTVSAGGWLKSVIDPAGKKTVFAYDAAGNVARTWERNATDGLALTASWSSAATPPSAAYIDQVNATPVTSDSLSVSNTALVTVASDGTVAGSGQNGSGELGDGTTVAHSTAHQAVGLSNVVQVAQNSTGSQLGCGTRSYFLTGAGEVWWAGPGQATPVAVDPADPGGTVLKDIIQIAAGGCHALALDAQGRLWAWGANAAGQIGKGTTGGADVTTPVKVLENVATIGAGSQHSLAVKTDGSLWTWGSNSNGQLGHGDTTARNTPTQIPATGTGNIKGVRAVSGGVNTSFALTREGNVWSWGTGLQGSLGLGNINQQTSPTRITTLGEGTPAGPVKQIIGASGGGAALMSDGTVRTWGTNGSGQLGNGTFAASNSPVAVPNLTGQVALAGGWYTWVSADNTGKIMVWGSTINKQRADGGSQITTATPDSAGLKISPYRQPGWTPRGTRDATGNLTTQTTDAINQVRRIRSGRGNETFTAAHDQTLGYDAAGRPAWTTGAQHRSTATVTSISYDPFGNPVKTIDARGIASLATFDAVNRQLTGKVTREANAVTAGQCTTTASGSAWTAGQDGQRVCISSTTYDGIDRQITTTDGASQTTRAWSDAAGRMVRVDAPRSGSVTLTSRWNYDRDGNVLDACSPRQFAASGESDTTANTPAGCTGTGRHSTHYVTDRTGRTVSETKFRMDGATATPIVTSYRYDADGNTVSVTDPNDHETTAIYDFQGRRTSQSVPRNATTSNTTTWTYDDSGNVTAINEPGFANTGTGSDGNLVVDGTTATASTDEVAHGAGNPFQIPAGAQYANVTLQNGAHVTASGSSKGLVFSATGTVTVCSSCVITMTGTGGTGGTSNQDAANPNPGHGGKRGTTNLALAGTGGGGGGHKADGSPGMGTGSAVGLPGLASGTADFSGVGTDYLKGSGGGGGGGGNGALSVGGNGGNGGGYIRINADKFIVNGTITAAGANGSAPTGVNSAGGGGGAGGGIWLEATEVELASAGVLQVNGGTGGLGANNRNGGNGADGRIRVDADIITNTPMEAFRGSTNSMTAISYDAANRPLDTLEGAQTAQADPAKDHTAAAAPGIDGLANTRTRALYNADGVIAAMLPPQAFTNAASLTSANVNTARRIDYDLDGNAVATYSPRYDNASGSPTASISSVGSGGDGGTAGNQQTTQCPTGSVVDQIRGLATYASTVGVCSTRATYNPVGKLLRQYLPNSAATSGGSDNRYLEYSYTADNLTAKVTGPDPTNTSGAGRVDVATLTYDGVGRTTKTLNAKNYGPQAAYTGDGLVAQTTGQGYTDAAHTVAEVTEFTYDANGNLVDTLNPELDHTLQSWTTDNRLAEITAPGPQDGQSAITRYTYDDAGNPTKVLSPNAVQSGGRAMVNTFTHDNLIAYSHTPINTKTYRSVRYGYTPAGLKAVTETALCSAPDPNDAVNVDDCVRTNTDTWHSGGSMRVEYGDNGRVRAQTGRAGATRRIIETSYAQHGGLNHVKDPVSDVATDVGYYLDGSIRTVTESGTGAGGANENTYAYDGAGQVTVRSDQTGATGATGGSKKTTSYAYNQAGLVESMISEVLGQTTNYTYDTAARLLKASTPSGSGTHVNEWAWHPNNSLARAKTAIDTGGTETEIVDYDYAYDNNRNIITQDVSGSVGTYTSNYAYTPAQQLKNWVHVVDPSGAATTTTTTYGYDRNNNRLSQAVTTGGATQTTAWNYREDNSIAWVNGPEAGDGDKRTYTYNNDGLLDTDGCVTNTYDVFDRTSKVEVTNTDDECGDDTKSTTYTYDGLDRQRSATVTDADTTAENGTSRNVYDGLSTNLVGQVDAVNGAHTKPTVLYQLDSTGTAVGYDQTSATAHKAFLDTDGHGNITTIATLGSSALACGVTYDPWGGAYGAASSGNGLCRAGGTHSNTTGNAHWYRGQVRDGSTGTYQLGTRTYDPNTGAFTTPDAYRVASPSTDLSVGTDPLTANTYTYVNGNPLNAIDPDGHRAIDISGNELSPCVSNPSSCSKTGAAQEQRAYKNLLRGQARARAESERKASEKLSRMNVFEVTDFGTGNGTFCPLGADDSDACVVMEMSNCWNDSSYMCIASGDTVPKSGLTLAEGFKLLVFDPSACTKSAFDCLLEVVMLAPTPLKFGKIAKYADDVRDLRALEKAAEAGARACSFAGTTTVLMADGTRKPIADIKVGDKVIATDPEKGEQRSTTVEHVYVHDDTVIDLVVDGEIITTTEDHPFWSVAEQRFERADQLTTGEGVLAADGRVIEVTGLAIGTARDTLAYNLAVEGIHTFHVGASEILVHNDSTCVPWSSASLRKTAGELERGAQSATVANRSQAEELFLRLYQGRGYNNATGMNATQSKKFFGSKNGTYHWDTEMTPGLPHSGSPHLQVHHPDGKIVRIFYGD